MNDRPDARQDPRVGLCADCRQARVVQNDRDTRFWLCERSRIDAAYPRFPMLPVRACPAYETK